MSKNNEEDNKPNIQADHNSNAVGSISAGGDISGNIHVGNIYNYASEDGAPLTNEEIRTGLIRFAGFLPERAPSLQEECATLSKKLKAALNAEANALSVPMKKQREETLETLRELCIEVLDISFRALSTGQNPPDYDARSPFRGLESFRPDDNEFFFGREALTQKLVGKIKAHSFLAVLGASGSGKSSLVMAGVIPALDLDYAIFRPGVNPLSNLESARGKSLIVVDQFEELFTLTRDEAACKEFIARLLDESSRAKIILTLRSDFLEEVARHRELNEEVQTHLENVPPMDLGELRRAMEGQAGVTGLRFEADLSQQILDDVAGEPGAMPLLQHALWELWNRRHGRNLRASEYRAFGGVKQAITSTAEKVYADCSKPEQDKLRDIFLRLTRLDDSDEGRDTRRRVPLSDLIPSGRDAASITLLLDKLANARLVVKTVNEDKTEIEVAHEALIRHWERLRIWLSEDWDALRLRESVSESAKEWEKSGKHESLLNSRWVKLDEALLLTQDSRYRLTEVEQVYLKGCVVLRNKEQRERERRLQYTVFASVVAAIIFLVLGGFGLIKSNEAEKQANVALARQLAAQAQSLSITSKKQTAVLLAIQSWLILPSDDVMEVLQNTTLSNSIALMTYNFGVSSVSFSPNSKYVVSGGCDEINPNSNVCTQSSIRIWEAETGKEIARMTHKDIVGDVAFSPDGKYIVSGSSDGAARVWETATGKEIARMTHEDDVFALAFSSDGKYIVSGSSDGTARVWETVTGKEIARMTHEDDVFAVAFSPNDKYVVSGSSDGTARVWEAATGKEIARMTHEDIVGDVAFSPDGKYVVSGSRDHTARVWDVVTGKEISRMVHVSYVYEVAFSPDGRFVVSGGCDKLFINCSRGVARVWEAATGKEISSMIHDSFVLSLVFKNYLKR